MELAQLAKLINAVAVRNCDLHQVEKDLRAQIADRDDANSRAAVWAFNYRLISSDDEEGRANYGPFGPMMELGGQVFPPYLADVEPNTLAIWQDLSDHLQVSSASARVRDLLWVRRFGAAPHEHAREAIHAYLAGSEAEGCPGLEVRDMLDRALELARLLNATELIPPLVTRMTEVIRRELALDDAASRPGVYVPLLRLLAGLPPNDRPTELGLLLQRAHGLHEGSHPFIRESLFQLSEMLEPERQRQQQLRRQKVKMWLEWALNQHGALRMIELSKALELANNTPEAADLADDIRRHLQGIDKATLGLKAVSSRIAIPADEAEKLISGIVGDDGLDGALSRFGAWGPPTGDPQQTLRNVEDQMRRFPLQFLLTQVVTHAAGYPIKYLQTDDQRRLHAQVQQEVLAASVHAVFAMEALDRIGDKFNPTREEVQALFQTDLINSDQANAFARAFEHYWAGDFDEAVLVALPRLESALRQMLAGVGGAVYKEPQGEKPGGVRMLGTILQGLEPFLHPGWWRFLCVVLTESLGFNLRNEYLHGLVPLGSKDHATLVLEAAAYLRLLRVQSSPPGT
jgi:hypothetical protein